MHRRRPTPAFLTYILFVCACALALAVTAATGAPDWLVVLVIAILVLGSAAQRLFPPMWKRSRD